MNDDTMKRKDQETLTRNILARTSGSPCARAQSLICDAADGVLNDVDTGLLESHGEHCTDCHALAGAVNWMRTPLSRLAEVDPGPDFTGAVLAGTLPWHRRLSRHIRIFAGDWADVLRRPRLAWEAAYVGAVIIGLLFAAPASPLHQVPGKALNLAQTNPIQALVAASRDRVPEVAQRWSTEAWDATGGRSRENMIHWRDDAWDRMDRAWDAGTALKPALGQLGSALWTNEDEQARQAMHQIRTNFRTIFVELSTTMEDTHTETKQDSSGDGV